MAQRICILGNSGSGKSTLGKALSKELNIPVLHLDRELLYENFQKRSLEESLLLHEMLISQENWIIEGNYQNLVPRRFERATLVIFLNTSRLVTFPRVILRAGRGGQPKDTVPTGAKHNDLSWEFIKWVTGYKRKQRLQLLRALCEEHGVPFLALPNISTEKQVEAIKQAIKNA